MKKNCIAIVLLFFTGTFSSLYGFSILEAGGWFEKAYVTWQPAVGAEGYAVYISGENIVNRRIDDPLIRSYGTYFRADVPGLGPGQYTLRIAPITNQTEGASLTTPVITVRSHHRSGFAFSNGRVPGAYTLEGTPKNNAVVLYITENNKNTVSMNVTGASANPCVGLQNILDGFKRGRDTRPLIIRIIGQITDLNYMLNGDIVIENNNNAASFITLEGIGNDAVLNGFGIRVKNAVNIEIRNIATKNTNSDEGDNIGLQQNNEYIWVHHCDFFYGAPGSASDQAKGDGALDSKDSGFITIAYNHFWDTGKSNLLGVGTETPGFLTYHHNWYNHSDSRHPRVRSHHVHVFNNYYDGVSKYGIGATTASSIFVEANYFRNCRYPMLISMQGSDVWDETRNANDYTNMPTFSKEDGGMIKAFNNFMTGQRRFVPWGSPTHPQSTIDFDAVVVSNRNEPIGNGITTFRGSNTYNNFDTNPSIMYAYTPDSPEEAKIKVMLYAGRMQGGDFKWTFNNAVDDVSSDVIPGLRLALTNYRTSLVSIQGDSTPPPNGGVNPGENPPGENPSGPIVIHNFTASGRVSTFFNITGNLSTTQGTVQHQGLTLTSCLKIESTTLITFTTTQESVLTLVFNPTFNGRIRINGIDRTASAGILTLSLAAGSHQITKRDVCNLYYISLVNTTTNRNDIPFSSLSVHPNPTSHRLSIHGVTDIERLEVFTLAGILVKRLQGNSNELDISTLNPGTYLLKISTPQGSLSHRIIKK